MYDCQFIKYQPMIKIEYENIEFLKVEYQKILEKEKFSDTEKKLLTINFKEITDNCDYVGIKANRENFNYSKHQQKIAKYFATHIKPTTCYYCNIDFINVYEIEKKDKIELKNGFTLDNVLPKEEYPYFALSLFNLVPSCYICNSKIKGRQKLGNISPTSEKFQFHEKVKFKTFINNQKLQFETDNDINVRLIESYSDEYNNYIEIFRLNECYEFHRNLVIEMLDKRRRYPDSRIRELADLTKQPFEKVKSDLFGKYLNDSDLSKRPLAKLTRDIAEELGLYKQ